MILNPYTVTVTDNTNGCATVASVAIGETAIGVSVSSTSPLICTGLPAELEAEPATPGDYSYLWSTGATTAAIPVELDGIYAVTLTNNTTFCTAVGEIAVESQNFEVQITTENPVICGGTSISLEVDPGYSAYSWTRTSLDPINPTTVTLTETTATIAAGVSGKYIVTVTDANGCEATAEITVADEAEGLTKEFFVDNGYLCFPITLTRLPTLKEQGPVKSGECESSVEDYEFNFVTSQGMFLNEFRKRSYFLGWI